MYPTTISGHWERLQAKLIISEKNDLHANDLKQLRLIFYAGASSTMKCIRHCLDQEMSDEESDATFSNLRSELDTFTRECKNQAAELN